MTKARVKWAADCGKKTRLQLLQGARRSWVCGACHHRHYIVKGQRKPSTCPACGQKWLGKYGLKPYYFSSDAEADRHAQLFFLQREGVVKNLKPSAENPSQPVFPLMIVPRQHWITGLARDRFDELQRCGEYRADFVYLEDDGDGWPLQVVEEVKASRAGDTELSKLKRKLVEAIYSVEIRLVYMSEKY